MTARNRLARAGALQEPVSACAGLLEVTHSAEVVAIAGRVIALRHGAVVA